MAKKDLKFEIDLVPKKPPAALMELANTKVKLGLVLPKEVPDDVMLRIERSAAQPVYLNAQEICQDTTNKVSAKIADSLKAAEAAFKKGDIKTARALGGEADDAIRTLNHALSNAANSLNGALENAVKAQLKQEQLDERDLLISRLKTAASFKAPIAKLGQAAARLYNSMGTDLKGYALTLGAIIDVWNIVEKELRTEEQVRQDFADEVDNFIGYSDPKVVAEAKKKGPAKIKANQAKQDLFQKNFTKYGAEHKNKVTSLRKKHDDMAKKIEGFQAKVTKSNIPAKDDTLKKLGEMSKKMNGLAIHLDEVNKARDAILKKAKENKLDFVKDKPLIDKLKAMSAKDWLIGAQKLMDQASDIQDSLSKS